MKTGNNIDSGKMLSTIAIDLSKVFDSLSHGLIIAKLSAYVVDFYLCKLLASYSYNRNKGQNWVKLEAKGALLPKAYHKVHIGPYTV